MCNTCTTCGSEYEPMPCWECGKDLCDSCMFNSMTLVGDYCQDCGEEEEAKEALQDAKEDLEVIKARK